MIIDLCPVEGIDSELAHGKAVACIGMLLPWFVRRLLAWEKDDAVEPELFNSHRGNMDVSKVDGVKGATKKADFFRWFWDRCCDQFCHLL